jgi:hypothetical protein
MIISPNIEEILFNLRKLDSIISISVSEPNNFLVEEIKNTYDVAEPLIIFTSIIKKSDGGTTAFRILFTKSYCDDVETFCKKAEDSIKYISEHNETIESLIFQNPKTNETVTLPEQQLAAIENPDSNLQDLINRLKEIPNVLKVNAYNVIDPAILENVNSDSGIVVKVMATFRNVNDKSFDNIYDVVLPKETYDDPTVRDSVVKNFTDYITNINM